MTMFLFLQMLRLFHQLISVPKTFIEHIVGYKMTEESPSLPSGAYRLIGE
jgi:hypothetical protein